MVANFRFQPGARINVEKLSKELSVSRTPVWEAVRRLQQEGLLQNIPYRGVFMVEMTFERALELYQVREVLEGLAGRLAVQYVNQKSLDRMAEILKEQIKMIERGDLLGYSQSDFEFHAMIHKMSRHSVLQEMLESLKALMQPIRIDIKGILPRLYQGHQEMIGAFKSKDPETIEKMIRRHNRLVQHQIKKEIESLGRRPNL